MIRYALRCEKGHDFESWFRSSEGFETLRDARQISCTECGSTSVDRALMAPAVASEAARAEPAPMTAPDPLRQALEQLRRHVEQNSDYVGMRFAEKARAMHDGTSPMRPIHGEARLDEARKLLEDGVLVTPLPFIPRQKTN